MIVQGYGVRWAVLVISALLAAAGCAGPTHVRERPAAPRPTWVDNPGLHPRCAGDAALCAIGEGSTLAAAERAARKALVPKIRSKIKVEFRSEMSYARSGEKTALSEAVVERILEEASFDHGECLKVPAAGAWRRGDIHFALAYLDAPCAEGVLGEAFQDAEARLYRARALAGRAHRAKDPAAFTPPYREALAAGVAAAARAWEYHGALGRPCPGYPELKATLREVDDEAAELIHGLRIHIGAVPMGGRSTGSGRAQKGLKALTDLFRITLSEMGINADACGDCPCNGPLDHRLEIRYDESCKSGYVGICCALSISASLIRCAEGSKVFDMPIVIENLDGCDTQDEGTALRRLYGELAEALEKKDTRQALRGGLSKRIASVFPVS